MKITIIGAGIGGLTAAIALRRKGFDVEVFESFGTFEPLGSGINLANNAMQVFRQLGLYDTILEKSNPVVGMNILDSKFGLLSRVDLRPFEQQYGVSNVAIHRSELQQILLKNLPSGTVNLGKRLQYIESNGNGVQLVFEDGKKEAASLVIGADGIHSVVRTSLFGRSDLRDAGQLCWRGITDFELPEKYQHELFELWGKGKRFGFVHLGHNKVYWYALRNDTYNIDLKDLFNDFDPLVEQLLLSTGKEQILENQIADFRPIASWSRGSICLLGDAAHATTPNLGQGACQAIESAWVFADSMAKFKPDFSKAFSQYEKIRKGKARSVITNSWRIGKMAHWSNNLAITLRNNLLRLTPSSVSQKQSAYLFKVHGL
jgi:2-polyprenyl-6-methoxyphenol hydroxylase-like FAD-dependent oxidoreductase